MDSKIVPEQLFPYNNLDPVGSEERDKGNIETPSTPDMNLLLSENLADTMHTEIL